MAKTVPHANRGAGLERALIAACERYKALGIAAVDKIPVAVHVKQDRRQENQVNVERERSIVDFTGGWNGHHLAFDAKENMDPAGFPLKNVKEHQFDHLALVTRVQCIAFLLILHQPDQAVYLLPFDQLAQYWAAWKAGGRASIPAEELRRLPKVRAGRGVAIDYLTTLDTWLKSQNGGLQHASEAAASRQ